jgi:hypothetical protein
MNAKASDAVCTRCHLAVSIDSCDIQFNAVLFIAESFTMGGFD